MIRPIYDIADLSPRDKIMGYLTSTRKDKLVLTDHEQQYVLQIDYADDIMRAHPSFIDKQFINMIMEKFGVSHSTARNILFDARYIHGTTQKTIKSYERMLLTAQLKQVVEEAMNPKPIYDSEGEILVKPPERNLAAAIRAIEIISKINGLDIKDDENEGEENQPQTIIIRPMFRPKDLGVELPENIEQLVDNLRKKTVMLERAENMSND